MKYTKERKNKIFAIGLGKTGTTSLATCLKTLGYKHLTGPHEIGTGLLQLADTDSLYNLTQIYDSFDDYPWPLFYQTLHAWYPDAFFILTIRKTPETWYHSLCKHFDRRGPTEGHKLAYGYYSPYSDKEGLINHYVDHTEAVRSYFRESKNLLEVCWENGDGWSEICNFLNLPKPESAFPNSNSSTEKKEEKIIENILARGNISHAIYYANNKASDPETARKTIKKFLRKKIKKRLPLKTNTNRLIN